MVFLYLIGVVMWNYGFESWEEFIEVCRFFCCGDVRFLI